MDTTSTSEDSFWMTDAQVCEVFRLIRGKEVVARSSQWYEFVQEIKTRQRAHTQETDDMADIYVGAGSGDFKAAPEGRHLAVCTEVKDLGMQPTNWGEKRMVEIWFQLESTRDDGERHRVRGRYSATLGMAKGKKSNLRRDLESWRGRAFTADELKNFNIGKLEGINAELILIHNVREDGKTFANINNLLPPPPGAPKLEVILYEQKTANAPVVEDSEVPF